MFDDFQGRCINIYIYIDNMYIQSFSSNCKISPVLLFHIPGSSNFLHLSPQTCRRNNSQAQGQQQLCKPTLLRCSASSLRNHLANAVMVSHTWNSERAGREVRMAILVFRLRSTILFVKLNKGWVSKTVHRKVDMIIYSLYIYIRVYIHPNWCTTSKHPKHI